MSALHLYELPPSPNSIAVRLAAGYKGVPVERHKIDGSPDRSLIVKASGQPLTPAMRHGDVRLFGSGAILRYLDANFDGPRLYSTDYQAMKEIESLEDFAKRDVHAAVVMVFGLFRKQLEDGDVPARASQLLHTATAEIEARLAERPFLMGDAPLAPDFVMAPRVWYGMVPEAAAPAGSIPAYLRERLELGPGRDAVRAWVERCMAYDLA